MIITSHHIIGILYNTFSELVSSDLFPRNMIANAYQHGSDWDSLKVTELGVNMKTLMSQTTTNSFKFETHDSTVVQSFHAREFDKNFQSIIQTSLISRKHLIVGELKGIYDWLRDPANAPNEAAITGLKNQIERSRREIDLNYRLISSTNPQEGELVELQQRINDAEVGLTSITMALKAEEDKKLAYDKQVRFLATNLQVQELLLGWINKALPPSIQNELKQWLDKPIKMDNIINFGDIDSVVPIVPTTASMSPSDLPWDEYTRLYVVLAAIRKKYGLSTSVDRKEFHTQLFNKTNKMKTMEGVKAYLHDKLFLLFSMLDGTDEALNLKSKLTCVVLNIEHIDRFVDVTHKIQETIETSVVAITDTQYQTALLQIIRADDHFWRTRDGAGKEKTIAFVGFKIKKDSQGDKMTGHGKPRTGHDSSKGADGDNSTTKITCNWCNKPGHVMKDCRAKANGKDQHPDALARYQKFKAKKDGNKKRPQEKKEKANNANSNKKKKRSGGDDDDPAVDFANIARAYAPSNDSNSSTAMSSRVSSTLPTDVAKEPTIIDSGANMHTVFAKPTEMTNVEPTKRQLAFGNNESLPIQSVGSINHMKKVGVVANMPVNLASPSQLAKVNGITTLLTAKRGYLLKPNATIKINPSDVLLKVPLVNGLYQADTPKLWKAMDYPADDSDSDATDE